jgi:hypothetical protein
MMRMRWLPAALAVTIVGLGLTALMLWQSRETERERVAQLQAQIGQLERRQVRAARDASGALQDAPQTGATPPTTQPPVTATTTIATPATTTAPAPAAPNFTMSEWQRRERQLLRDPAYRRAQIDLHRQRLASARAGAIRVVGMTPEQADRVIELWAERNLRYLEMQDYGTNAPTSTTEPAGLIREFQKAEQDELRALLGEEKLAAWNRYLASASVRGELTSLSAQLSTTPEPLRESQIDALVDIIYTAQEQRDELYRNHLRDAGVTDFTVNRASDRAFYLALERQTNQRIRDAAAGTLSAFQAESLDDMLRARLAPIESALRLQQESAVADAK